MEVYMSISLYWLVAMVVFFVIEGITQGLVTLWFGMGALAATFVSLLGGKLWLQWSVFVLVSLITLCLLRGYARGYLFGEKVFVTNGVVGKSGIVISRIGAPSYQGKVQIGDVLWSASSQGLELEEGQLVSVKSLEGNVIIVDEKEDMS